MATDRKQPNTHISKIKGKIRNRIDNPTNPNTGDMYFNTVTNCLMRYTGNNWIGFGFT